MADWLGLSCVAILLWGCVGLFQKLGTNRISARSLLVWLMVGFMMLLPWFMRQGGLLSLRPRDYGVGILGGLTNGLGSWFLFAALEEGAKASVAVPLTALYPLVTVVLAGLVLGESLTGWQWIGVGLALVSGVMLSYEKTPTSASAC
jgi:bacterial/archaeal transporter family protein